MSALVFAHIQYTDNVGLQASNSSTVQTILDRLNDSDSMLGMRFANSKSKMLLHDLIGSKTYFVLAGEHLSEADRFIDLRNFISSPGRVSYKVSSNIHKT